MFQSDDVVFAWVIGKALLIIVASLGILLYLAWAVTLQREKVVSSVSAKDGPRDSKGLGAQETTEESQEARHCLPGTLAREIDVPEPEQPTAAA